MIPRTKACLNDLLIAAAFLAMGFFLPGSILDKGFYAHLGGIAIGLGVGWMIKSIIAHTQLQKQLIKG